jgi:hypothetical protein
LLWKAIGTGVRFDSGDGYCGGGICVRARRDMSAAFA